MKKTIKRILSSLLVLVIGSLFLFQVTSNIDNPSDKNIKAQGTFQNNFFNTDIPSGGTAEDFVKYEDIHAIIENAMTSSYATNALRDQAMKNAITTLVGDKRVAIYTSEDLYNFSIDASYNWRNPATANSYPYLETIELILSLDYALLNDIDYSQMRSKQFIPIGIDLIIPEEIPLNYKYSFTGTFDGNGYKISNLYLADYNYITMIYRFNDDEATDIELSLTSYYAMFANIGKTGVVCNLEIENPIYELLDVPDGLSKAAVLAGENEGLIYNVGVVDQKTTSTGTNNSGIRWSLQYGSSQTTVFTASGLVNTNCETGQIHNSYYASQRVIATGSDYLFRIRPVVYENRGGIINGVGYDNSVDNHVDDITQPQGVIGYTTNELRAGLKDNLAININDTDLLTLSFNGQLLNDERHWYYYVHDCMPTLLGLEYDNNGQYFRIEDEYDLVSFSKLISFRTQYNTISYNQHTYVLINHINMKNIISYQTPLTEFRGILKGGDDDFSLSSTTNTNKNINSLVITIPYTTENEAYYGLLGNNSGTIKNINFLNCSIEYDTNSDNNSKTNYIGIVSAVLKNGIVRNIISNTNVNLKTEGIGQSYIGGLIGYGNGLVEYVANNGTIDGGSNHNFANLTLKPQYAIGGIIGGSESEGLTVRYAINNGVVKSIGTVNTFTLSDATEIVLNVGGIIGQLKNSYTSSNSLYYLTNNGNVEINTFAGQSSSPARIYAGGIFGNSDGYGGSANSNNTIYNGRWENNGLLIGSYVNTNTYLYLAGIGVASTQETKAEFSYMINTMGYQITGLNSTNHNENIFYASTIIDNSTGGITLSRAYNEASYEYDTDYFSNNQSEINIAPFFTSTRNNESDLIYCQNNGNITVGNTTSYITTNYDCKIAGITLAYNVNYQNVYMCGDITVTKITQGAELYVSGIAWILPYLQSTRFATNCMNEGKITTADINGNTTISSVSGTAATSTTFSAILDPHNLYVAGLFNLNVGEITNSMNRGDITSDSAAVSDITGTCNTFVGGLVTINYNLIQDCANAGHINYTNANANSTTYVAGGDNPDCLFGGLVFSYNGGLSLGGVVSALADTSATILEGYGQNTTMNAQILDSSNNGNVYGKARQYVRSGGILAVALGVELTAGTSTTSTTSQARKYSYCEVGSGDRVANAMLSNGLNFGTIGAFSSKIGDLTGTSIYSANDGAGTSYSTPKRPGIYACAGGVIAYGLCRMKRMLNHGTITSTDVAGGIVGATYILGTAGSSQTTPMTLTIVDIDTAVHYGRVKAARSSNYNNYNYDIIENISSFIDNTSYFYADNDPFIFPTNNGNSLSLYPNAKRGFGGIFGRLQRGNRGIMQSSTFINIMNMDENVDMIGRADQSSYNAYIYYRFGIENQTDTYYSARENDSSPAVVVGYATGTSTNTRYTEAESVRLRIRRQRSGWNYNYTVNQITVTNATAIETFSITRRLAGYIDSNSITYNDIIGNYISQSIIQNSVTTTNITETTTASTTSLGAYGLTTADVSGLSYSSNYAYINIDFSELPDSGSTTTTTAVSAYQVETVTDNPSETNKTYIFDSNFPLMDAEQSNYIYAAENPVLADRFRLSTSTNYKPYGMYVLASTKGQDAGAVLPANLKIDKLYKINETNVNYIDIHNVTDTNLITDSAYNQELLYDYQSMFQIRLNDKSSIMPNANDATLYDIVLYDPNDASPILTGGIIGTQLINGVQMPTITFQLSRDAFNLINNQSNVYYEVLSATLSENAIIANTNITDFSSFHEAYANRTTNILDGDFKASIAGTVNAGQTLIFDQYITVYSEIATQVDSLLNTYKTNYVVIIECSNTELNINLESVVMDDNNATIPDLINNNYNITSHTLLPNGTITATFVDVNKLLPIGHALALVGLYYGEDKVDEKYYDMSTTPNADVNGNNTLIINAHLSDELKSGVYTIRYQYYNNTEEYSITFTKSASTEYSVVNVDYNTYTSDQLGNSTLFNPTSVDFITYIEFGAILNGVTYNTIQTLNINPIYYNGVPNYVNNLQAYELLINDVSVETIFISPFATLTSATVSYTYDANGNRQYIFNYQITNENNEVNDIVHTVEERVLPEMIIYKNNNLQYNHDITIAREDLLTSIYIDFNFVDNALNNYVTTQILKDGTNYNIVDEQIYFDAYTYYEIYLTYELETGLKEYIFTLTRDGVEKVLGSITIEKLLGVNAYLQDINFQTGSETTLVYPLIYQTDASGNTIVSPYDIRVYYDGIDYDGSDLNGVQYFRIDGKVADIDLENYTPEFTLPAGAVIERWDSATSTWSNNLYDNFIGDESQDEQVIMYKITSEDGSQEVYYYITAVDILYNLTLRFTLYYRFIDGTIVEANDPTSPIRNSVVLITVKNYTLDGDLTQYSTTTEDMVIGDQTYQHTIYPHEATDDNPGGITDYIVRMTNQSTMFYAPTSFSNYQYTFGRNFSGCYGFSVVTPLYTGPETSSLAPNERYNYEIYAKTGVLGSGYPWANNAYILPELDKNNIYDGKYFFIGGSIKNRIREFSIVIEEVTEDKAWGLTDKYTSWN